MVRLAPSARAASPAAAALLFLAAPFLLPRAPHVPTTVAVDAFRAPSPSSVFRSLIPSKRGPPPAPPTAASVAAKVGEGDGDGGADFAGEPVLPPSRYESVVDNASKLRPFGVDPSAFVANAPRSVASGLAVSLAMVPEAVAFSFVAGVSPLAGLWTTATLGFVAATFGGRPGVCSSASGACSVVVAALCAAKGPAYLSACAMLAGAIQMFAGLAGWGKFIRLVPHPVMLGFVNGLALVMGKAQLVHFRDAATGAFLNPRSAAGGATYGITALTMVLVRLLPKVPLLKVVPPSLGAVAAATALVRALSLPVKTLADVAGAETFVGGMAVLPKVGLPAVPMATRAELLDTLGVVWPFAVTMAAVGCIESLLTMQLLDGMDDTGKRGSTTKECIGQGLGNLASGLTGGIGGCALLGQSIINVESGGGKSRLSAVSMAVFLALGIVSAAPLLGTVPIAALTGVMLLVCQSTFSWSSLRVLRKVPKLDALVIALVSYVTVRDDLAKAVVAGTVASALGFAWNQSSSITAATKYADAPGKDRIQRWKAYYVSGPVFFGSSRSFSELFDPAGDPDNVVIDFGNSRVMDHSALECINDVADKYGAAGKKVYLRHLSSNCAEMLAKINAGRKLPPYEVVERSKDDPAYDVAMRS